MTALREDLGYSTTLDADGRSMSHHDEVPQLAECQAHALSQKADPIRPLPESGFCGRADARHDTNQGQWR